MTDEPRAARYVRAVGPRLKKVLAVVFGLFTLLAVNSVYLAGITLLEWSTGRVYQNWFYLYSFLLHVALGLLLVVPVVVFGAVHIRNAHDRKNRRAVRVGYALFAVSLALLASGLVLTRLDGVVVVRDPAVRSTAYWVHVVTPLAAVWLFVLHRLAGPRLRWRVGLRWTLVAVVAVAAGLAFHLQDPRGWGTVGNPNGLKYFFPSLARTDTGDFISARVLQNDDYCKKCHADTHRTWARSAHRFSSFNNPAYLFSVRETRQVSLARDGNLQASRWCAGCHDPVPFFSGRFDDPKFDDVNDPTGQAGITCTVCHAVTHVNSVKGNADYTIETPVHYPFAFSDNPALGWINRQLVKAKPAFHKATFLKPLHKDPAFCGSCHKVHLPPELNAYKWLRGQNHYDSFWLSGVSGHGVASFYYPPKAQANCNGCHMPLYASDDFGNAVRDESGELKVHDHQFPAANTAIVRLVNHEDAEAAIQAHEKLNQGVMRVDVFGVREGGAVDGPLVAPLRPQVPALEAGKTYLLETVVRTVKMGHDFTQGTADSNEVWLDVTVRSGARVIGRSGARGTDGRVDPWSHFINVYMLGRDGRRIDRRNAQDIFVPLYNNQIPPGGADVVHYALAVPADVVEPVTVEVALRYRKFDTTYMKLAFGEGYVNDLPVMTLATDQVVFPVGTSNASTPEPEVAPWERWNDYGIGLLRKARGRQLRQAEDAFRQVEALGRADGPLNLARVYLAEGRVQVEAPEALARARALNPAAPWTVLWLAGQVNKQNARYEAALADFRALVAGGFVEAQGRGFDFSKDYRLLDELGQTLYLWALESPRGAPAREARLREAVAWFEKALALEPEDLTAHWGLKQAWQALGDGAKEAAHAALHATYKPDDGARDVAVMVARQRDAAANHAAEPVVIYDLGRAVTTAGAPAAGGKGTR